MFRELKAIKTDQRGWKQMENQKRILLFQVGMEKENQIRTLCRKCDISVQAVIRTQYGETLGALAGIVGMKMKRKPYTGPGFLMEMMVFSGIGQDELDVFLKQYRENQIPPIALKAMLTPYNIHWSAEELYQELGKEHMEFLKRV